MVTLPKDRERQLFMPSKTILFHSKSTSFFLMSTPPLKLLIKRSIEPVRVQVIKLQIQKQGMVETGALLAK